MGNKKKIGSRYKCFIGNKPVRKPKVLSNCSVEQSDPSDRPRPRVPSSSKKKLEGNLSLFDSKSETLEYEFMDVSKLELALGDVASCKYCHHALSVTKKSLVGLVTEFTIQCKNCDSPGKTFANSDHITVKTNKNPECQVMTKLYDINLRFVYGMRVIGKGYTAAQTLCGILNVPPPPTVFAKYERVLAQATESVCEKSMNLAIEEAVLANTNTNDRDLCVAVDGSWQKRGHTSLNGIVSLTSVDSGKVLDIECMSKYCLCPNRLNNKHLNSCNANYIGTSGGMESEGAVAIFNRSVERANVRYIDYLGDGDSNAYKSVCDSKPYGENVEINKIECVGHVQKRMGSRLRTLKMKLKKIKLADGKPLSGKNRLTDTAVQKLQIYYGLAIRRNCHSLADMKQAVWATYHHVLSSNGNPTHELCPKDPDTWCRYNQALYKGEAYDHDKHFHLPEVIMETIKPIFKDLANPELLKKCLKGKSQNPNESLNNLIWSRVPKRTFVNLTTLKFGAKDAVLSFNEGYVSKCKVLQQLGLEVGKNLVVAMKRLDTERIRKGEKSVEELEKKIRQGRTLLKRKLEDLYQEAEGLDNPAYAAGEY